MGSDSASFQGSGSTVPLGDNYESAALVQQARNSAGGFDYGSDRAIGSPPNWASQESVQLYRGATVNNDPATAEATGQAWKAHGDELHQAANDLYNAVSELGNAWIGKGAAAAQGSLVAIANSSQQAGDAAHTMASRMAQQASAAAEVKKMPAPKDFDPARQTAAMLAGGPAAMVADMKQQSDEANAVHQQQVQYFNAYTQAMSEVDDSTPSFGPESLGLPPDGSISATKASSVGAGTGGIMGAFGGGSLGPLGGGQVGGVDGGRGSFAGNFGGFGGVPGGQPAGGVPAGDAGGTAGSPAGTAIGTNLGAAAAHAAPIPINPSGGSGAALGVGLGIAGAGLAAAGGKAVLGRGNKSGAKADPDGTEAAATAEGQGNSASANMPQQGPLVNSSGTIGSNTPPPAMGGAGAHAAEDEEHERASFLVEADPDEVFGANASTAPPVIGAWDDEDED